MANKSPRGLQYLNAPNKYFTNCSYNQFAMRAKFHHFSDNHNSTTYNQTTDTVPELFWEKNDTGWLIHNFTSLIRITGLQNNNALFVIARWF